MNGINTGNNDAFVDSKGDTKKLYLTNYYFAHKIGQRKLMLPSQLLMTAVIVITMLYIIGGAV
jgi:ech hydrogenase subunit A